VSAFLARGARVRRGALVLGSAMLVLGQGCAQLEGTATRYRAERMGFEARREEARLRTGKTVPDSTTMLRIRAQYARLRAAFHPPFVQGTGSTVERIRRGVAREVGTAELTAARVALEAHRPEMALESARWVSSIAEADTGLGRESLLAAAMALRALRRYDEAIETLHRLLDQYPPMAPSSLDEEDQILGTPDAIIELRAQMGDSGVREEQRLAVAYYRRILDRNPPPLLESQVRARRSRTLLEMGDANGAFAEVTAMRHLASKTPELKSLEPELLYTEARIRATQGNHKAAMSAYESVVKSYPASPYAARALLDAGVLAERGNDRQGAVARYRAVLDRRNPDPSIAAVASYRMAMLKEQMGNWPEAKQLLENIPLQFPKSRGAVEAPFAIVEHYMRSRDIPAAKGALLKAVDTYRGMIARDTGSVYCTVYRWNILRAYTALRRWPDALATVDEMAEKDRGAPVTVEALFQGAQIAATTKDKARSDLYLRRIVQEYPRSPRAVAVRSYLERSSRGAVR
jgi:TolA-binding protein